MEQYYYLPSTGQTYSGYQIQALFGINPSTTAITTLNRLGIYPVQATSPDFDLGLYDYTVAWALVPLSPSGEGAERVYTPVAKPLAEAKENGSNELKEQANAEISQIVTLSYLSTETLTSVASQDPLSRSPFLQSTLDQMDAVSIALGDNLAAVDACTTVDEINNIVNPPSGTLFTGRGSGLGPEDLNVSYYTAFNSLTLTEADTELYVPSTAITISYGSGGPGQFDSFGNAFNPGGPYTMQIREVATSNVIAEFEVPLNPTGEDVAF
jgi:hypothetical protein